MFGLSCGQIRGVSIPFLSGRSGFRLLLRASCSATAMRVSIPFLSGRSGFPADRRAGYQCDACGLNPLLVGAVRVPDRLRWLHTSKRGLNPLLVGAVRVPKDNEAHPQMGTKSQSPSCRGGQGSILASSRHGGLARVSIPFLSGRSGFQFSEASARSVSGGLNPLLVGAVRVPCLTAMRAGRAGLVSIPFLSGRSGFLRGHVILASKPRVSIPFLSGRSGFHGECRYQG